MVTNGMSLVQRSYFDDLPIDNLETILRSLVQQVTVSYSLRADRTYSIFDMHYLLSLFCSDTSPFRAAVPSMFTKLGIFGDEDTIFSIECGVITMGFEDTE